MINANIQVAFDAATPAIKAKLANCDPHLVATRVAVPLARHWRDHLKSLPRNKNGWPSSNFWEDAARKVTGIADGPDILLYSDKLGLRKRYYGGPVKAVNVKNLTIPIAIEAAGTKAADWGDQLTLVILGDGRKFLALWTGSEERQKAFHETIGKAIRNFNKRKAAGKIQIAAHETLSRRVNLLREKLAQSDSYRPKVIVFKQSSGAQGSANAAKNGNLKFLFRLIPMTKSQTPMPWVIPPDLGKKAYDETLKAIQ